MPAKKQRVDTSRIADIIERNASDAERKYNPLLMPASYGKPELDTMARMMAEELIEEIGAAATYVIFKKAAYLLDGAIKFTQPYAFDAAQRDMGPAKELRIGGAVIGIRNMSYWAYTKEHNAFVKKMKDRIALAESLEQLTGDAQQVTAGAQLVVNIDNDKGG